LELHPRYDGKTHINMYTRGQTDLGRLLSNIITPDDLPVIETPHGKFATIEGYWHWLGHRDERLRTLSGWDAKAWVRGRKRPYNMPFSEFYDFMKQAITYKITHSPTLRTLLKDSTLPFTNYYVSGNRVIDPGADWLCQIVEDVRDSLR